MLLYVFGLGIAEGSCKSSGLSDRHRRSPRCSYSCGVNDATSREATTAGVRELKNQLSSYLARVKAGEEIVVTEHGRAVARLTGLGPDVDRRVELIAAGIIRPAAARRRLPSRRVRLRAGDTISSLVAQQRR
jgi:prevent-host-death family protein